MILVGENLNIMSKTIGPALKERIKEPVVELAKEEMDAGIDYLDLNIGPARKAGDEMMTWLVNTVQEVSELPLSLDTTNPEAMAAGLKLAEKKALINSVSLQPERLEKTLPLVKEYNASMIGLLWGVEGMPRDANERCMLTVDLLLKSLEFMSMLGDIAPGCKSIVGLSNVSNGTPHELRPYLNRTYMIMLMKYGLYSAIVDAFDEELVKIARGEMPEIVSMVHGVMDGEEPDITSLNKQETDYLKTAKVLLGQSLYSHSWLEI